MFGIGTTELILVLAIILIIFGVGKLPEIGSGMGKAIKNFKKATTDPEAELTGGERHKLETTADKTQKREV